MYAIKLNCIHISHTSIHIKSNHIATQLHTYHHAEISRYILVIYHPSNNLIQQYSKIIFYYLINTVGS